MDLREVTNTEKSQYDKFIGHIMQSWQWGEFRKNLGVKLKRYGIFTKGRIDTVFQITFHQIPFTKKFVGYFPKGPRPTKDLVQALKEIGIQENCAFIKLEPNVESSVIPAKAGIQLNNLVHSPKPLFTKYNFILDLTKSEEELLKSMSQKTRYNIRVAQKHGVKVCQRTDNEALKIYLKLYFDTCKRQGFHGHNTYYHTQIWNTLRKTDSVRLLIATYQEKPLTAWMLFNFKDTLYYAYGGSSVEHKEVMANNLICWQAILMGKKMGLKNFDMWGALGPNANTKDPWYGFHKFKLGYGGKLVEYIGTYDLVFDYLLYFAFTFVDKLMPMKVLLLKLLKK